MKNFLKPAEYLNYSKDNSVRKYYRVFDASDIEMGTHLHLSPRRDIRSDDPADDSDIDFSKKAVTRLVGHSDLEPGNLDKECCDFFGVPYDRYYEFVILHYSKNGGFDREEVYLRKRSFYDKR